MPLTQDYWCIKAVIIASFARCIVVVYYIISYSICMQFCKGVHTAHLSHPFALHHHTKKYPRPRARIFQYIATVGYAPKLSKRMFSAGTPRLSSIFTTDEAIIGGPHIK